MGVGVTRQKWQHISAVKTWFFIQRHPSFQHPNPACGNSQTCLLNLILAKSELSSQNKQYIVLFRLGWFVGKACQITLGGLFEFGWAGRYSKNWPSKIWYAVLAVLREASSVGPSSYHYALYWPPPGNHWTSFSEAVSEMRRGWERFKINPQMNILWFSLKVREAVQQTRTICLKSSSEASGWCFLWCWRGGWFHL